jgi:hypothetical protein
MNEDLFLDLNNEEQVKEKIKEIARNIEADENFYLENASHRYEAADQDYNNERLFSVVDSDGNTVNLKLPSEEKQLIKRYSGLVAGSKDNINITPVTKDDSLYAEVLSHFIKFEFKKAKFNRIKSAIANQMKRIGNCYVAIVYDADMWNERYNDYGVISIELIPYHEMILDLNSRNSYDSTSPYYRNRETRRRRVRLSEVKKIIKQEGHDWFDKVGAHSTDAIREYEPANYGQDEEYAYLYEHTFRERIKGDKGKLKFKHFTVTLVNNNPQFVLDKITESALDSYNTLIFAADDRSDTPYSSGYMEETKSDREEQAQIREAKLKALRSAIKNKTFFIGLDNEELKKAMDTPDTSIVGIKDRGVKIVEIGKNPVSEAFAQAEADARLRKQEKGGEFATQAGAQPYGNTTGKLANVLNSRSDLAKVQDVQVLESGIEDLINIYLQLAIENYDMPLIVQRLSEDGSGRVTGALEILFSSFKTNDSRRRFDINVTMDLNSDNTKAQMSLMVQQNRDLMAPKDILEKSGMPNPDLIFENWAKHQGILDFYEFAQQFPQALEVFEDIKAKVTNDVQLAELAKIQTSENPAQEVVNK